jgi:putative ABC transport system permease protein
MMLLEALAVGLLGSLLGLAGGVGLAAGIRSLLDAIGFRIPARGLALEPGTVVVTMVAGVLTTLVAAVVPAIASGRIAPVAAMSEVAFEQPQRNRLRAIVAAAFIVVGVAAISAVVGGADGALLGVAVVAIFVGVLLLGPVMANPIATVLGAPVQRLRGVTGTMARSNVKRNPKRTARTGGAGAHRRRARDRSDGLRVVDQDAAARDDRQRVHRRVRHQLLERRRVELQPGLRRPS